MNHIFEKKLLPAVTLDSRDRALRLAETYLEAGLDIMEVTFRTEATLDAIEAIASAFPEMNLGAGTILNASQIASAKDAGARFGLSPGCRTDILREAGRLDFDFIPGVSTPSDIERALAEGITLVKLFPADLLGGIPYIRAMNGPYGPSGVKFIPMGGVDTSNLSGYLSCSGVTAAGGSWLAPRAFVADGQFERITEIVRESLRIARETD